MNGPNHARRSAVLLSLAFAFSGPPTAANAADAASAAGHEGTTQSQNRSDPAAEQPFLAENDAAMTRMMDDMAIKPSGDVDQDFVAMMAPHHQGAIDMALAELRYGRNETLRRMAQEIIVTQQQEIAAMRLALGQSRPPYAFAPDRKSSIVSNKKSPRSDDRMEAKGW